MRILFLADRSFATRERAMLGRLEIALTEAGSRLIRASPALGEPIATEGFGQQISYEPPGALGLFGAFGDAAGVFGARGQAKRLARKLEEIAPAGDDRPIDVIHAWGEACWSLALETAWLTGASVAIDVWSERLVRHLRGYERRHIRNPDSQSLVWLAPYESMRTAIGQAHTHWPCVLAPWGVHASREIGAWSDPERPASIVVCSCGRDPVGLLAAMKGLAGAMRAHPNAMVFMDAQAMAPSARIWSAAKSLGLLERLSLIPDLEGRRELALRADLFLFPDKGAGHRSIVLDALAVGATAIARGDEYTDELVDGQTALLVAGAAPEGWKSAIERVLGNQAEARALSVGARDYVRRERTVSGHVRALTDAYQRMLSAASITPSSSDR